MSTFIAITISGLALGAVYFLIASGLSLIYGLMDVLNFAHGVFLTLGAYAGWAVAAHLPRLGFAGTVVAAAVAGAAVAAATEVLLIRPLYGRPISQILVTIGLDLALVGLLEGGFGSDSLSIAVPGWLTAVTAIGGERIPNGDFLALGAGLAVLGALTWFLRRTRYGMIIRAGAENRDMVRALGIDVGRAFTRRVRGRRRRRRARGPAQLRGLQRRPGEPAPGGPAADLRVHRRRDRRPRFDHRLRASRPSWSA